MADLSRISIGASSSLFRDAYVQAQLDALNGIVAGGISVVLVDSLPTNPGAANMGKIYFVRSDNNLATTPNGGAEAYDEYVVKLVDGVYSWEKIGTIDIDLSSYSKIGHKHTVTPNVTIEKAVYTPEGTVSLPTFTSTPTNTTLNGFKVATSGTGYTLTPGVSSRSSDATSTFAKNGKLAAFEGDVLSLVDAVRGEAVTASGTYSYTSPTISGSLPTFGTETVLAKINTVTTTPDSNATFTGAQADILPSIVSHTVDLQPDTKPIEG